MIQHNIKKLRRLNPCLISLGLIFLLFFQKSLALENDQKEQITIEADSVQLNHKLGINLYQGHVNMIQGSTHLTGDKVYVLNNSKKEITEIISIGNPDALAHYETLLKENEKVFDAFALTIKYFPQKKITLLIEKALARQGNNTFQGPFISYNINTQSITSLPKQTNDTTDKTSQTSILIDANHPPLS
jgi:lipopolysaccharide export system protein LptA